MLTVLVSLAIGVGSAQTGMSLGANPESMLILAAAITLASFNIVSFLAKRASAPIQKQ